MMNCPEVTTDLATFSTLREEVEEIIDLRKRLPDFVFTRRFEKYFAVEYAHVYRASFAALLFELSKKCGDELVNYMVLDPPADAYYGRSSVFGLISFAPSVLLTRYVEVMYVKGCSQILVGANLGVFWGSSLRWGIFADRVSWELALIATDRDLDVSTLVGWPCFSGEQVRDYMTSQYHAKDPSDSIAREFSSTFLSNYRL